LGLVVLCGGWEATFHSISLDIISHLPLELNLSDSGRYSG
jgi:hypothetical protein